MNLKDEIIKELNENLHNSDAISNYNFGIRGTKTGIMLFIEIPGYRPTVEIENKLLTIIVIPSDFEIDNKDPDTVSFFLPDKIDTDHISSAFNAGILYIIFREVKTITNKRNIPIDVDHFKD